MAGILLETTWKLIYLGLIVNLMSAKSKPIHHHVGRVRESVLVACLLLTVFLSAVIPLHDLDFWWHLAVGRLHVEQQLFPRTDPFSHTAAALHWDDKEWLFGIIIYLIFKAWGIGGAIIFKAALVTAASLAVYLTSRSITASPLLASGLTLVSALASRIIYTERPWLFTLLLEAVFLFIIIRARAHNCRLLWLLPVLTILWVNLHPAAIIGIFIIYVFLLEHIFDQVRRGGPDLIGRLAGTGYGRHLAGIALVSPMTYLLSPAGFFRYTSLYEIQFKQKQFIANLEETKLAPFSQDPYFYALLLLSGLLLMSHIRKVRSSDALLLFVTGYLALEWKRNIPIFAIACVPFLTASFEQILSKAAHGPFGIWYRKKAAELEWAGIASLLVLSFCITRSQYFGLGYIASIFPEEGVEYVLSNGLKGNLFNIYDWGGYLVFRMYPNYKVFIDGRGPDAYTPEIWREYEQIRDGAPEYSLLLDKNGISIIFIPPGGRLANLVARLSNDREWGCVFQNSGTAIYVRTGSENFRIARINNLKKAAISALNEHRFEDALADIDQLTELTPDDTEAWFNAGFIRANYLGKYDDAISDFSKVVELAPRNVEARVGLAEIYEIKGDRARSLRLLQEARHLDPGNRAVLQKLDDLNR